MADEWVENNARRLDHRNACPAVWNRRLLLHGVATDVPEAADVETTSVGSYISGQVRTIAFFLFAANLMLIGAEFPHARAELHKLHATLAFVAATTRASLHLPQI